ncbi:hypothetical protein [Vibrio parahaemolyticus]|uniref:hypothetical protein n=1 Tax=Vibrio parahaemolyticus TaxID=670 RepID=UPI0031CC3BCA
MNIKIYQRGGFKDNHDVLINATEYFCKMLMSTRMCNTLNIRLEMRSTKLGKNGLGSCYTDALGSKKNKDFIVILKRDAPIADQLKTLAHECVHIHQKATNLLQYRLWKSDGKFHARWNGEELGVYDAIPYQDRPWEIEAYFLEDIMHKAYFFNNKNRPDLEEKIINGFNNALKYLESERSNNYRSIVSKQNNSMEMTI